MNKPHLALVLSATVFFAAMLSSCETDLPVTNDPTPEELIVGEWVSEGVELAVAVKDTVSRMVLTFGASLGYTLTETDLNGTEHNFSGSFSIPANGAANGIYAISLQQNIPGTATFEGICGLNIYAGSQADELSLEIVRTQPSAGFAPPTVAAGFGSTNEGGEGVDFVQKYRREK